MTSPQAVRGNLSGGLARLQASLGISPLAEQDSISGLVSATLVEREIKAEIVSIRFGTLTLRCDRITARFLHFDRDVLLAAIEATAPGAVSEIRIHVGTAHRTDHQIKE